MVGVCSKGVLSGGVPRTGCSVSRMCRRTTRSLGSISDLKVWGMAMLQNGGKKVSKARKKKAVVAVARKLAVLLHRLWATGEVYDPQYNRKAAQAAKSKAKAA